MSSIDKSKSFGRVYLALFLGAVIGMLIGYTVLKEQIAMDYMVSTCTKDEDINAKYFRCEY